MDEQPRRVSLKEKAVKGYVKESAGGINEDWWIKLSDVVLAVQELKEDLRFYVEHQRFDEGWKKSIYEIIDKRLGREER